MKGEGIIGAADTVTKAYIRKNEVFADAFNYFMYDGRQKIQPEQLRELDSTEIAILLNEKDTKDKTNKEKEASEQKMVQKYRDLLKTATIMEDGEATYVLLGIENQTEVHYAMPVRNMLYDAMQYNKLIPVITLVLFFNPGEWDGPRSLFDMLDISNPIFKKYAQDYKIHIISPKEILESDLKKFSSSLREVIGCIKYSNDKNKLAAFIQDNPRMNIEVEAARVLEVITHTHIKREEVDDMGNVNMCKAIQEMIQDGRDEGRVQLLVTLIQSGDISLQRAAALMNMTPEEFQEKSKMIS